MPPRLAVWEVRLGTGQGMRFFSHLEEQFYVPQLVEVEVSLLLDRRHRDHRLVPFL